MSSMLYRKNMRIYIIYIKKTFKKHLFIKDKAHLNLLLKAKKMFHKPPFPLPLSVNTLKSSFKRRM